MSMQSTNDSSERVEILGLKSWI